MKAIIRYLFLSIILYTVTLLTYQGALAYNDGVITNSAVGGFLSSVFFLLNFPIWIIAKGTWVFTFRSIEIYGVLLLDNLFVAFIIYYFIPSKKPEPPIRKSNE